MSRDLLPKFFQQLEAFHVSSVFLVDDLIIFGGAVRHQGGPQRYHGVQYVVAVLNFNHGDSLLY